MRFEQLKIKNFKSFVGNHSFDFCGGLKGLHFITGENLVSKKLEGNGVGKSSIWDAVCWCLYGRTLRGLKASNVASWSVGKSCEVEFKCKLNNESFTIYRSWSPNKLLLNSEPVEQNTIENLIKLTFESFQHAIVLGQFSTMFFDLQPSAKLALFSQVLSLDFWLKKSDDAKALLKDIDQDISNIESSMQSAMVSVNHLKELIKSSKQAQVEFEDGRSVRIQEIETALEKHRADAYAYLEEIEGIKEEIKQVEKKLNTFRKEEELIDNLREQKAKLVRAVDEEVRALKAKDRFWQNRLTNFHDLCDSDECPTCYSVISDKHKKSVISALEGDARKVRDELIAKSAELDELERELESVNKAQNDFRARKNEVLRNSSALFNHLNSIEYRLGAANDWIADCEARIGVEQRAINPFDKRIKEDKEKLVAYKKKYQDLKSQLIDIRGDREAVEYWVKGFKDIRLFLIEEALTALEVEVNNNLLQLGLKGWTIKFDVERETKSGTISKGFQVFINSPANSEPVPWESWSGGETQRLRVAGTLGLSNLICSKLGVQSDVLVLDEPTTHLNPKGVEALMNLLENKARQENKQIWLVDHRALDYGGFASVTKVTKQIDGSCINTEVRDGE